MSDWSKQCNCTAHLQAPNKQAARQPPGSHFHSFLWQTKMIKRAIANFPRGRRRLSRWNAYGHVRRSGAAVRDRSGRSPRNEDLTEHFTFMHVCLSTTEPPTGEEGARRRSERRLHSFWHQSCRLFRCFGFQVRGTLVAPRRLHWLTPDLEMIGSWRKILCLSEARKWQ